MTESGFEFSQFVGRFHPALVHLPIGFLVLLAVLELAALKPRFKHLTGARSLVLVASALVACGSAASGWLLADGGGYDAGALAWHRWSGVGVAAGSVLLLVCHGVGLIKAYRALVPVVVLLVAVTGHFGGSLTHGADYLAEFAPAPLKRLLGGKQTVKFSGDVLNQPAFVAVVRPVLDKYCVSCHGPQKSKAQLRMDNFERLMKGSENGAIVVAGKPDESEMIKRLLLPEDSDDHMPPVGKAQPSEAEIALLKWWVEAGASSERTVSELSPPPDILQSLPGGR
ncbi:MAG: hypothetical protein EPO07_13845 [Verrucomicrobia bacterium]|nr:MAG: hypothetical protein EPO07_13845 [Verrucomicrobiota bacterium]